MQGGRMGPARTELFDDDIMRYLLQGLTMKEAAVMLDTTTATVANHARTPEFLVKLKALSSEIYKRVDEELHDRKSMIMARLEQASELALEEMVKLAIDAKDPKVKFMASQDLMDRDGRVSRQKKVDVDANHAHRFIDPMMLIHVAKVAQEMDRHEQGQLPEGEPPSNPSQV